MGKAEREKGKRFERAVRDLFRSVPGYWADRTGWHQSGGHHQLSDTKADVSAVRLGRTPSLRRLAHEASRQRSGARAPLHVEAKYGSHTSLTAALTQAEQDAREGDIPIVVHQLPRGKPMVSMRWPAFARLLEMIEWD